MCRHFAYVGPPRPLDALVLAPPHSLLAQARTPTHQPADRVNGDGFGVGWFVPARRPEPAVYRTATPIWADRTFPSIAALIEAPAVLAAVRAATPPSPVEASGNAPFTAGPWLFSLNGAVTGFRAGRNVELRATLPAEREAAILGASDSEVVFAMVLGCLDQGASPADAVAEVMGKLAPANEAPLNLLLTDGSGIVATAAGNSLFTRQGAGAVIVASEPLDDDLAWTPVPDGSLVVAALASARAVEIAPL